MLQQNVLVEGGVKRGGGGEGGCLKLPFPLRNAGENQSLVWQGWVIR